MRKLPQMKHAALHKSREPRCVTNVLGGPGARTARWALGLASIVFATGTAAHADTYVFALNGGGITASGTVNATSTGPFGAYTLTSINGTFSDTNNGISGAITGLESAPAPKVASMATTFRPPAYSANFSYDNLLWIDGNSPAVCADALQFYGGYTDIYGWLFDVQGGYTVDVWNDGALGGARVGDALNGNLLSPGGMDDAGYAVNMSVAATPEPGSLWLLGTGAMGLLGVMKRRVSTRRVDNAAI